MFGQRDDTKTSTDTMGAPAVQPSAPPINDPQAAVPMAAPVAPMPTDIKDPFAGSMLDAQAAPMTGPQPTSPMQTPVAVAGPEGADDLLSMKQEALKHLQPLVGNLQQSPEEEFRTLMMMIQATDDKTMLKKALEAAKRIPEDKSRAQAMLDVINEINYFTQSGGQL